MRTVRFMYEFQELEEFWAYKALLIELTRRLTYCVQTELIPLMEVAGVMEVCVHSSHTETMFAYLFKVIMTHFKAK